MTKLKILKDMTNKTETVSPEEYLKLRKKGAKAVRIVPPKLGKRGFGKIEITHSGTSMPTSYGTIPTTKKR